MKLRTKLATLIAAFVLVAALTVVGVLAVQSATVNLGGTVNFVANDIIATVSASVTGTSDDTTANAALTDITFTAATTEATAGWSNLNWNFANKNTNIVLTITVTNNSTERALTSTLTNPTLAANTNVTVTPDSKTTAQTVAKNTGTANSVQYVITFSITDKSVSVSNVEWTASIALANVTAA